VTNIGKRTINASEIFKRIQNLLNLKSDKQLAMALGISQSTFSSQKNRNTVDIEAIVVLAKKEKLDLNYIFLGRHNFGNNLKTTQIAEILLERLKLELSQEIIEAKDVYENINSLFERMATAEAIRNAKEGYDGT